MDSELCGFDDLWAKSESDIDINGDFPSDDLDHVPLLRRRSMLLLANKQNSLSAASDSELIAVENGGEKPLMSSIVVKGEEDEGCSAPDLFSTMPACSSSEVGGEFLEREQNHGYKDPEEDTSKALSNNIVEYSAVDQCLQNGTCGQDAGTSGDCFSLAEQIKCQESSDNFGEVGKIDSSICSLPQSSTLSEVPAKVKVELSDSLLHSVGGGMNSLSGADVPTVNVKNVILDHIPYDHLRDPVTYDHLDHIVLKERQSMLLSRKLAKPVLENSSEALAGNLIQQESAVKGMEETHVVIGRDSTKPRELISNRDIPDNDHMCSSASTTSMKGLFLSTSFKIKDEPQDENNCHNWNVNARDTFSFDISSVKTETEISNELDDDEADHVCLGDRMKLLRSADDLVLNLSRIDECMKKSIPFVPECVPIASESVKAFNVTRPRKRKKTATDSVETALEEDAPGLLQVLVEKGVTLDEIKLYGETESEALDESFSESFSELEAVISKLFTRRPSFLKLAPVRFTKGARASYCLACLISLVEQTRYLQFRKWPVEWGWCRDLQSFIFVFERHNRIVLERPEYGYATYFFELVDSLSIDWQIKRLVTAMKLTNCSRICLIENKALLVGEDLTEGEAQVLIEYGWVPNSGLGTMLNYCDRVVHDRKKEMDTSEWRSKIGKLLMDGYNGGTIVSTDMPKKVMEYRDSHGAQIKLELHD